MSRLRLADGRGLAWAEFGDPGGRPLLYCHGFPGSRLEAGLVEARARELGVRLIAADRPGIGASDPAPGRRLLDWPADLAALADHLGLSAYHLAGMSGGAPYALACALRPDPRLEGVVLISGLGPLTRPGATRGMLLPERLALGFYRRARVLAGPLYGLLLAPLLRHRPEWGLALLAALAPAADGAVLRTPAVRDRLAGSVREALRQGPGGVLAELGLITSPWGFDPVQVAVRVQLWHGLADTTVPPSHARWLAGRIPDCSLHLVPGEGHFSLAVRHAGEIIAMSAP